MGQVVTACCSYIDKNVSSADTESANGDIYSSREVV
jgi:hypothetical protein